MQSNTSNSMKQDKHKSIFSYNIYRTNNHEVAGRQLLLKTPTTTTNCNSSGLKSTSLGLWKEPEVIYFNDRLNRRRNANRETSTQTSKTILELAKLESGYMSPDSLTTSPRLQEPNVSTINCPYSISNKLSDMTLDGSCHEQDCLFNSSNKMEPLTQTFLKRKRLQSRSFIDTYPHPNYVRPLVVKPKPIKLSGRSSKSLNLPDNSTPALPVQTFMKPTASSLIKSKMAEVQHATQLIPHLRRGRSLSPRPDSNTNHIEATRKIPYIDQCKSDVSSATTIVNCVRNPEKLSRNPKQCSSLSDVRSSRRRITSYYNTDD